MSLFRQGAYGQLLAEPGVPRLLASALLGRLQLGMMPLGLLLLARHGDRSYGASGAVVAAFTVMTAVAAPLMARLVDRRGPRTVLFPCAIGFPATLVGLVLSLSAFSSLAVSLILAALCGALAPPISPCIRALWPRMVRPELQYTAFSLEATVQELVFVTGPLLVGILAQLASPVLAVAIAGATAGLGTLVFATDPLLALAGQPEAPRSAGRLPVMNGVLSILAFVTAIGTVWGLIQIVIPAFAEDQGEPIAAGIAVGAVSVGSVVGGLVVGHRRSTDRVRGLQLASGALLLALLPPLVAPDAWLMVGCMFVVGLPMAPALASSYSIVGGMPVHGRETETFAWLTTAMTGGVAIGLFVGGAIVNAAGIFAGLVAMAAAGGLCAFAASRTGRRCALDSATMDKTTVSQ